MIASKKAKTAELRHQIKHQAEQLFSGLKNNEFWVNTEQVDQSLFISAAKECAQLFHHSVVAWRDVTDTYLYDTTDYIISVNVNWGH